jgi:hypothetical protein
MAYAIMVDASSSDVARFERRGVKIINLPGSKSRYPSILLIPSTSCVSISAIM